MHLLIMAGLGLFLALCLLGFACVLLALAQWLACAWDRACDWQDRRADRRAWRVKR